LNESAGPVSKRLREIPDGLGNQENGAFQSVCASVSMGLAMTV
jgi:hypothetical protein